MEKFFIPSLHARLVSKRSDEDKYFLLSFFTFKRKAYEVLGAGCVRNENDGIFTFVYFSNQNTMEKGKI